MSKTIMRPEETVYLGHIAITFGILFWPLSALVHDFFLEKGVIALLFHPEPNEAWMRLLVSGSFIFFGLYTNKQIKGQLELSRHLYRRKQRLRAVINTLPSAYVCINAEDGAIVDWNPRAEKLFGWSREEVMHQSLLDTIVPERLHGKCREEIERYLGGDDVPWFDKSFITMLRKKNQGEVEVKVSGAPIVFDGHHELYAFIRPLVLPTY